jgi:prepilin-type N-terminal cleavage/methylation domain-containing protein
VKGIPQPPDKGRRLANAGFTITEVLIASALLVVGVSAIFPAAISAIRTQHMSSNLYHATCLARNRVQRGLALPFDTLPALASDADSVDQDGNANANGPYLRTTTLTPVSLNCYRIVVEVSYPIGGGAMSAAPAVIQSKIARAMHSEVIEE